MAKRHYIDPFRGLSGSLIAGIMALIAATAPALAATPIKIGRTSVPNISHLPIYLAMETGLFRQEGLDAKLVPMPQRALVTAGLGGTVDFVPLPDAGAKAALRGAALRFVVGQSLFSTSALVTMPRITAVAELRHQVLGFERRGQVSYRDGEEILRDKFGLVLGNDYRITTIPNEPDRLAALENGEIQASLFSLIYAAKAQARGFRRLFRSGTFAPRVKGAVWTRKEYLKSNRTTVRRFIRAIAGATDVIHRDGRTTIAVLQKYFGIYDPAETKALWLSVRDIYTADIPAPLLAKVFAERLRRLRQRGVWPREKKASNPEHYIARGLLTKVLTRMAYDAHSFVIKTGAR
jgi:ABC-type nitrate/sulfonate/bicarbonate transport system substrate-binding protein